MSPFTHVEEGQRTERRWGGNISDLPRKHAFCSVVDIQDMGQRNLYEHWHHLHMVIAFSQWWKTR